MGGFNGYYGRKLVGDRAYMYQSGWQHGEVQFILYLAMYLAGLGGHLGGLKAQLGGLGAHLGSS